MYANSKLILPVVAALLLGSSSMAYAKDAAATAPAQPPVAEKNDAVKHTGFEDRDANKDGFVDMDEIAKFAATQYDSFDADKDGTVTTAEMDEHHSARRALWEKKHDQAETDRPKITPEMKERVKARADERRKKYHETIDPDHDGKITKDEFVKNAIARHKDMDSDGDGKVSKEEIRQQHEKRKEEFKQRREKINADKAAEEKPDAPAE